MDHHLRAGLNRAGTVCVIPCSSGRPQSDISRGGEPLEQPLVSQPAPFSQGQTTVTPQSDVSVDEEKGRKFIQLKAGASLVSLVNGLNALGVTPRDMISILQTTKAAGALQAEIEVM